MQQHFSHFVSHLFVFGLALLVCGIDSSDLSAQGFNVTVGSATVDISSGSGVANVSIDIAIENPTASALPIAGYSFFLEVEPTGTGLPTGVTFDNPAATYSSGNGAGLLSGANANGTINLTPAAGDLGLGQIQFFDATVAAGATENLLTVNFVVDLAVAVAGDYSVSLSAAGQNSISSLNNTNQTFTSSAGVLTLDAGPLVLGDVNCDGAVDFLDIGPFIALLSSGGFLDKADINQSGAVDFLDIGPFIALLSS